MDDLSERSSISTPKSDHFDVGMSLLSQLMKKQQTQESALNIDEEFIQEIIKIANKKKAEQGEEIIIQYTEITDEKCEEIHEKAKIHAQACTFNENSTVSSDKILQQNLCLCGCKKGKGNLLPFCENETHQYFFGPGIILFFFYMRRIWLLILCCTFLFGIFSLATNIIKSDGKFDVCEKSPGTLFFLCEYKLLSSTINKKNDEALVLTQLFLGFLFCFVWLVSLRMIQTFGRNLNQKIDHYLDSSSDYCIQVDNLPFGSYTQGQILKYLIKIWKKEKENQKQDLLVIKSVQIIYNMEQVRKILQQIFLTSKEIVKVIEKNEERYSIKENCKQTYNFFKEKLQNDCEKLEALRKQFISNSAFRSQFATNMALVQFEESDQQTEFVTKLGQYRTTIFQQIKGYLFTKCEENDPNSLAFKGNQLKIIRAPEPSDIHWNNCEKPFSYKNVAIVWGLTFCIVGLSFGMIMLIKFLKSSFQFFDSMSILISISLQLFNRIIWLGLVRMISLEENNTKTDNIISIMSKSAVAQSINVILLPIISNLILDDNLEGPQGLIGLSLDFQFTVLLMMLNLHLINFPYQIKRLALCIPCIRNALIRYYSKPVGIIDTNQEIKDVLQFYEPPQFPIAGAYVYITTIIFQAFFFCYAQPTLLFYLTLNVGCFFLVQKYLLLRRCKIPSLVDFLIFETCISKMKYIPFFYGIGSLMFMILMEENPHPGYYIPSCLCIVLWFVYVQNPKKICNILNKALISCIFSETQDEKKENSENESSQINLMKKITRASFTLHQYSERRQCYYRECNTKILLNYESRLAQVKGEGLLNRNREFCEKFNLNVSKKRNLVMTKQIVNMKTNNPAKSPKKESMFPSVFMKEKKLKKAQKSHSKQK